MSEQLQQDYQSFAKGPRWVRQHTLKMIVARNERKFVPVLIVVAQQDPDADLRQQARETLESWGYRAEGDSSAAVDAPAIRLSALDSIGIGASDDLSKSERRFQKVQSDAPGESLRFIPPAGTAALADVTGGTGMPQPRSIQLSDVFVSEKKNQKFVLGEADSLPRSWLGVIMALIFGVAVFVPLIITSASEDVPLPVFLLPIAAVVIGVVVFVIESRRRARLMQEGVFLLGQIDSCTGRWVTTGSGKSRSRSYQLSIEYHVRVPNGQLVEKSVKKSRNDMSRGPLPVRGTRVAVMYADDKLMWLL